MPSTPSAAKGSRHSTNAMSTVIGYYGLNQYLIDGAGQQYSSDDMAGIIVNGDNDGVDINPGNHVSVQVIFDVPEGAQPAQLVLHDSAYSGGAKVNLSGSP